MSVEMMESESSHTDIGTLGETSVRTIKKGVHSTGTVLLSPVVLLNISNQFVRTKMNENITCKTVYGAVLGKQNGPNVEVSANHLTFISTRSSFIIIIIIHTPFTGAQLV